MQPSVAECPIVLPPEYIAFLEDESRCVAVETPALRCRVAEACLADALRDSLSSAEHGNVVVSAADPKRAAFRLLDWCEKSGIDCKRRLGALTLGTTNIWVISHDDLKSVPVDRYDRCYLLEAHQCKQDDSKRLFQRTSGKIRAVGVFSDRVHWFYEWARAVGVKKYSISASVVVRRYPDQAPEVRAAKQRYDKLTFRRVIGLEDVDIGRHFSSFVKFGRERLKIRDKRAEIVPFEVTPVQARYLAMKRLGRMKAHKQGKYPRYLVLKSRREGITTLEQGLGYQDSASKPNRMNVTLAHLSESTNRIFRIAKLMHDKDPYAPELRGVGNATRLEFPALNSLFFIGTAGSVGFGRGDTLQRVHGSEVSKWCKGPRQMELVSDLIAGLTEAASHGEVTLETTADGLEWFYNTWQDAKKGLNDWYPIFLPWFHSPFNVIPAGLFDEEEIKDTLTEEENHLRTLHGLSYGQVAWRRAKIRELGPLFKQEYPEDDVSCFLTSGTLYYDLDVVLECVKRLQGTQPLRTERVPGGMITYWEDFKPGMRCVAGTDTSEGLKGCDENGTIILERETGRHVAQVYGLLSIDLQARIGARLCTEYGRCLWGIERNNTSGGAVVAKAQSIGFRNLFEFRPGRAGWSTDSQTRPVMLNRSRDFMNEHSYDVMPDGKTRVNLRSQEVIGQCMTFKLQPDGNYAADPGTHDDAVIMYAIANEMRSHAANRPGVSFG